MRWGKKWLCKVIPGGSWVRLGCCEFVSGYYACVCVCVRAWGSFVEVMAVVVVIVVPFFSRESVCAGIVIVLDLCSWLKLSVVIGAHCFDGKEQVKRAFVEQENEKKMSEITTTQVD